MDTAALQAASAVASLVIAGFAVFVANRANEVAQDAVKVAEGARDISRDGVLQARRQAILATVPSLSVERPKLGPEKTKVYVKNGGPGVAYGILASIAGAADRTLNPNAIDEKTRR